MLTDKVNNYKSRGGAVETIPVECPYCHQLVAVDIMPEMMNDESARSSLAIETCRCPEAQFEKKRRNKIERIDEEISYVIGKYSDRPLDEKLCDDIRKIAKAVSFGKLSKATINISKKEKINLKTDSKGNLIVEREVKNVKSKTI